MRLGDLGRIVRVDREGLHDLNLQVEWYQRGSMYWVRFVHVELLGHPPPAPPATPRSVTGPLAPGDLVRVRPSVDQPRYKWGFIDHSSTGVITSIASNGRDVTVDFPQQPGWTGQLAEMERATAAQGTDITCTHITLVPLNSQIYHVCICLHRGVERGEAGAGVAQLPALAARVLRCTARRPPAGRATPHLLAERLGTWQGQYTTLLSHYLAAIR